MLSPYPDDWSKLSWHDIISTQLVHLLHAGKLFEMGLDVLVGCVLIERMGCSEQCHMFERRTYTLDAKDFKRIIDFVLRFQ